ncbi:GEVED domain-containing protein [Roseiconus lacunae]|uniref:GEVED domain-containing protein n=1 Tax=Roseiconus lacunae TaxID=2605694 RepID=A0ABT7PID9_9BACT|nr:GEVED domain-containing protein [Roseiconus lacunae]MDM4016262.1 GEVED domain-containing protein [Roseiconus lacunae]
MTFRKRSHSLRSQLSRVSSSQSSESTAGRRAISSRGKSRRRDEKRKSLLENLENRQLLAGPELIGIQPNEGDLLRDNDTLNFSPNELTFRFDDNSQIDPSTLDSIRITRAGEDNVFEAASVISDLGTGGSALFEFRARETGSLGNGIQVILNSNPNATSSSPVLSTDAEARTVTITLSTHPSRPTRAGSLESAINNARRTDADDPMQAGDLIEAIQVSGASSQALATSRSLNEETLTLDGANAAQAVTDFGTGGDVRVRLISQIPGEEGREVNVIVEQRNFGGPTMPVVVVSDQTIRVQLNSYSAGGQDLSSTAADFVNQINNNPQASALVRASIQEGNPLTRIGSQPVNYSPIQLSGVSDVAVEPGYVGLGDSSREVVFRFSDPLPDDTYQIDILGAGTLALRGVDGEAFEDGTNFSRRFNINLGPQVVAVVPEPVRRLQDGSIGVETGIIEVHFNDDDLDPALAEDPSFYQLIFTRETANNTDDVTIALDADGVQYNSVTNIARLNYKRSLARISDPANPGELLSGAVRLRVGQSAALPMVPQELTLPSATAASPDGAGDSFETAFDLNSGWSISGNGTSSAYLTSEILNEQRFGLELPGPDVAGTRQIRPEDPSRLNRVVPLDYVQQGADSVDGISVIEYDFVASWLGDNPNEPGIAEDYRYVNIISEQQKQRVREVMTLYSEYLGVTFVEVSDRDPADIAGFSIAVGDLYGGDERGASSEGGLAVVTRDRDGNGVEDLVVMDFQDFDESTDDQFGGEFFRGAMFGVGQLLGYGYADDLPQPVTQSTSFIFSPGTDNEPAFPAYADILHGQYLYRPDSTDIDMYEFVVDQAGSIAIETLAERLTVPSLLDTQLRLYREVSPGEYELVAQNDDYFSNDSLIRIDSLAAGRYMIGVSAKGNDTYDPAISGTGYGGLTQGSYELRVDFTPTTNASLTDISGVALDGDADGTPGGNFDYWFVPADPSETIYVDKGNTVQRNGVSRLPSSLSDRQFIDQFRNRTTFNLANAYSEIDEAVADASRMSKLRQQFLNGTLDQSLMNDASIVRYLRDLDLTIRVVGNGGRDGLLQTPEDNFAFNIGYNNNGTALADGTSLDLPADVQLFFDSGAIVKFGNSRLSVGSFAPTIDLSGSNLQVLGTPSIITENGLPARDAGGAIIPGDVYFTSVNDDSIGTGNQIGLLPDPVPGDWGGIDFRGDLDLADELRNNPEDAGIFANHVQFANIRYGGGLVPIGGDSAVVSPINMSMTRATVINSTITDSSDAAMSATPDTFREDRFTDPKYQDSGRFTSDYTRVGPEIHGNTIIDNSINGLFIRLRQRSGEELESITRATRFDDTDITHVLTENLVIAGTPGGAIVQSGAPSSFLVRLSEVVGGGGIDAGEYVYRLTNVSEEGLESAASDATVSVVVNNDNSGIRLVQLPTANDSSVVSRRLYRATVDPITGTAGTFQLVANLNASNTTYTDRVETGGAELPAISSPLRSRLDASLVIDPATVIKVDGARIEARFGANLIAEGTSANPVVITSLEDQRYGSGGTFDTNDRGNSGELTPGDWGGVYIGHGSVASFDNAVIAGAGGSTRIEGGFASFNPIEVHQGTLRLTNSRIEHNADGRASTNGDRVGRGDNATGTVFVRASTPIIVNNDFIDNDAAAITIDLNSLNGNEVSDHGRSTGMLEGFDVVGNLGPLVEDNTLTRNGINGMLVRGGELVTEGVWDDIDIVHVVDETIEIPNQHIYGGLRLISDARGSLVVKFETQEGQENTNPAGIVVGGSLLTAEDEFKDIADRIGGALQLIGHPDFPVVMTAISDDFVGAGFTIDGFAQVDTDNDGVISGVITGGDDDDGNGNQQFVGTLPTGPEVDLGTTIDNDVAPTITGSFSATIEDANQVQVSAVTVENLQNGQQLVSQDYIFLASTYLTSGGATTALNQTTITQAATLVAEDTVESRGTYAGPNGTVNWVATTYFIDGLATMFSTLDLNSSTSLGDIRVISYLDEDVQGNTDDLLYTVGTPGQSDFRVYTVDGPTRVGFSHGGFYTNDGTNQVNATYEGWAADEYNDLETQIQAGTQAYSVPGVIDLTDLPAMVDPTFGSVFGAGDVTTALSWVVNSNAFSSRVTSFLELLAADPTVVQPPSASLSTGQWDGVTIREGADDRNVAAFAEQEPVRMTVFENNAIPGQAQYLGQLAPNEQSGDENRRLGFIVDGAITTRDDIDVYSFVAESGTEVWLDIDRTSNSLDTVIELVDINGNVLAASNDSLLAEQDPSLGLYVSPLLDSDSAQALTVNEQRVPVAQFTFDAAIANASSGSFTLGLDTSVSTQTVNVSVSNFLANPAAAIANALNSTFSNEIGFVTAQTLSRSSTGDYAVEVHFDPDFFTAIDVPGFRLSTAGVFPSIPASPAPVVQNADSVLQDTYSYNYKDAGMRIRLPGETGTLNQYHVRVRSSNTQDPTDFATLIDPARVDEGLTRGRYSMQIRLREADESAGTQVRLTDIRYATNGLQIIGQPLHSQLTGEEAETTSPNDQASDAQPLGYFSVGDDTNAIAGPLQSDRLAKSISGTIDSATDVDWYSFQVRYDDLTRDSSPMFLSTVIDLDYASNFARSDMALYVFDSAGNLIYTGTDSNVAEDLPASPTDNSTDDLSRGGAGNEDPFIGSVELPEGTYYVAVSNQTQVPLAMDQFFNPASSNPLVRVEPIAAIDRVADDNMQNGILFDNSSIVPYSLDDVYLYVNTTNGLHIVNPFTGVDYGEVGNFGGEVIRDAAFRANGELYAYTQFSGRPRADDAYFYVQLDTGTGTPTTVNTAPILTTLESNVSEAPNPEILEADSDEGVTIEALTIREYLDAERGFFVGNRAVAGNNGIDYRSNILWEFDPSTGIANGDPFVDRFVADAGAGTDRREVGQINTSRIPGGAATQLGVTDVVSINAAGNFIQQLFDGDGFSITSGMDTTAFEFDLVGAAVQVTGAPVLDGDTLTVGGTTFEFDTGRRLRLSNVFANGGLDVGQRVIVNTPSGTRTYEFIAQGTQPTISTYIPIIVRGADGVGRPVNAVANDLAAAITQYQPDADVTLLGNEVAFGPDAFFTPIGVGLTSIGSDGVAFGNIPVLVDESFDSSDVLDSILDAFANNAITADVNGLTFTVPGASTVIVNSSGLVGGGTIGVTPGAEVIQIELDDTASDVAQKVTDVINSLGATFTASEMNHSVQISGGNISVATGNLVAGGLPQGGLITGVEIVGNDIYAISDAGSLYRVTGNELIAGTQIISGNRQIGSLVSTATDLQRIGERFTGLRAGPNDVDGGIYSNVLFGITQSGNIYAFNLQGELVPYFAGGRSMISTGIEDAQGLDFSTLDYNLWHFTNSRSGDAGHNNNGGTTSLAFNYEGLFQNNYSDPVEYPTATARRDGQAVNQTYNFPGGAKGEVLSKEFSLANYSSNDLPTLYFTYLIEADGGGSTDALRVFVVEPDGTQHAVALNTTVTRPGSNDPASIGGPDDEFDDPPLNAPYNDTIDVDKQQLFDNTDTWRQARVPLSEFAGLEGLRLLIEFSTAGRIDTGSTSIQAVAGSDLVEGQSIRVSGETFEVNFPPTLVAPAGAEIAAAYAADASARAEFVLDGQTYVLDDGTRTIDGSPSDPMDPLSPPNEIAIDLGAAGTISQLSSADVANLIRDAVSAMPPAVTMTYNFVANGNSIEFGNADDLSSVSSTLLDVRNVSSTTANAINVRAAMSADEVAQAIRTALLTRFIPAAISTGTPNYIPVDGAMVSLPGFNLSDSGPFVNASQRYVDQYGATPVAGSRNNEFNGVYLDDFIIGLAERGEQVVDDRPAGSGIDTSFVTDTRFTFPEPNDPLSDLVTGSYQVEIRDSSEYITSVNGLQFREFNSNERLSDGITLEARSADQIVDGQMFSITDGRATVEFEFDFDGSVTPGRVRVPVSLSVVDEDTGLPRPQTATQVASSIIDAINRSDVRSVLDVQATPSTGFNTEVVPPTGIDATVRIDSRINLVGNVLVSNEDQALAAVDQSRLRGDSNRDRDAQGVIMVENSRFLFNSEYGISLQHDATAVVAGNETDSIVRYPRNLVELNSENYVPGVVVQSNIVAFNGTGGIQIDGLDITLNETNSDPVNIDRIVNNTIIGGSITAGTSAPSDTFAGLLFDQGLISFADAVVDYSPDAGGTPPTLTHQTPDSALGAPDGNGRGNEPVDGQTAVSLGLGGSLTVQFTDNYLTGDGTAAGDLVVFETGAIESVLVEISRDGLSFTDVGIIGGLSNQIDIDQFGFGPNDRFAFVRLTDLRQGDEEGSALGADIDAIGAISSAPVDQYTAGGVGISINGGSSPTLLNNVIANTETGITLSGDNGGFISGGNSFYKNTNNADAGVDLGQLAQVLTDSEAVFVDPANFVFAPASGSRIIDSSIDSLPDRPSLTTVRNSVGIAPSPVLAPVLDVNGQVRVDDPSVEPPSGLGDRVFKDRGGFDRGDMEGPRVTLLQPYAPGIGLDAGRATVAGTRPDAFEIQLIDGLAPSDNVPGTGIDDGSVSTSSLILFKDGEPLVEGTHYRFAYNPSTNVIRLTPIAGSWEDNSTYLIRMIDASDAIVQAGDGVVYPDGAKLTVVDSLNQPTVFEYETGLIVDFLAGLNATTADGVTLELFDGARTRSYQFDSNNSVTGGAFPVTIPAAGTTADFVALMADAINADTVLSFTARASGETLQLVGGTPLSTVTSTSGALQVSGSIGTETGFGFQIPAIPGSSIADVADGQSIQISLGSVNVIDFEFDVDGLLVNQDAVPVSIDLNDTLDEVANALVRAIGGTTLGLAPENAGFGRVFLGGDTTYSVDVSNSTATQIALPGQGPTVPINIPIDLSDEEIAELIKQTIDAQNLTGVSTSVVDVRVFLEGTGGVSGFGAVDRVVVQDQVGNQLQPNQADGRTELTIFIGTGYDYGDAPAPYTSSMDDGGPRHAVDPALGLGATVTAEADAELPNADSSDDGITLPASFQAGFSFPVGIFVRNDDAGSTGDLPVYVDAWFDWNQNGQFEVNERYRFGTAGTGLTPELFNNTTTSVLIDVPASALSGSTYARFRLSEQSTLGPNGDATSGEVEDYEIFVGTNPYTNASNRYDANDSGNVTPIDALQIINSIARNAGGTVSVNLQTTPVATPIYPDVNGDGIMSATDALAVINELARMNATASGEGEGLSGSFVSAAPGVFASASTAAGDVLIQQSATLPSDTDDDETNGDELLVGPSLMASDSNDNSSVFDLPEVIELDSIVDDLAKDKADAEGSKSLESGLDDFFASL